MERRGPSHLGPFGQACMNCFKSKCKCVARPDGPGCQRCHRLKKACHPSDPARRQSNHKKDSDARIAQLEKKIDGLISRLGTRDALDGLDGDREPTTTARTSCARRTAQALGSENLLPSHCAPAAENEDPESQPEPDPPPEDEPDEILLGAFRSRMLLHFPFVHLPPELEARRLGTRRPLLLRAIVCVASRRNKDSRCRELRHVMSEALLDAETDRIDLLLALLTYLSWGWDHSKIMPRLMLQAISLACEIQAHSNSGGMDAPEMRMLFLPGVDLADRCSPPAQSDFLEHHRAVLGCFVLGWAVATHLNHSIDALRWTPQMAEGLAALGASRECPTDAAFAVQVRLQLLAQKAVHIRQQQQTERSGHMQTPAGTTSASAVLVSLATIQGELQALRSSLPAPGTATDTAHHLAHAHAWATELAISEARYAVDSMVPFMVGHFSAMVTSSGPPGNGERAGCLWQCVGAAKACTDALLALSAPDLAGMPLVQWAQLARGLVVLHYLTTSIEDPLWDRAAARAVVDMPERLDRVAEKMGCVAVVISEERQKPEEILTGIARRMRELCAVLRGGGTAREQGAGQDVCAHPRLDSSARDLWHIPVSSYLE